MKDEERELDETQSDGTADVAPRDFGGQMRRARERRGISLRQIAITTKISASALEALERNDVSRLPGGIFSRAFVRSYAMEVGLDPEQTVKDFIARFPSEVAGHSTQHKREFQHAEDVESQRQVVSTVMKLLGISVPIAIVLVYFTFGGEAPAEAPGSERPRAPEAVESVTVPSSVPDARPAPTIEAPPPASTTVAPDVLRVGIAVTGPCWVSIVSDGRQSIGRVMNAGERVTEEVRNEIVLQVGDAGHFTFTINDRAGRALGSAGQVVTARINPDNYETFLTPR